MFVRTVLYSILFYSTLLCLSICRYVLRVSEAGIDSALELQCRKHAHSLHARGTLYSELQRGLPLTPSNAEFADMRPPPSS